jgi:transposase
VQAYSLEFRRRVLADCDAGMNTHSVAVKYDVSKAWVRRLKQRRRESGEVSPRPPIKRTPPKWHADKDRLIGIVQRQPDITLRELRDQLGAEISLQTLSVALRRLKYTLKKKSSARASRTGPMSR